MQKTIQKISKNDAISNVLLKCAHYPCILVIKVFSLWNFFDNDKMSLNLFRSETSIEQILTADEAAMVKSSSRSWNNRTFWRNHIHPTILHRVLSQEGNLGIFLKYRFSTFFSFFCLIFVFSNHTFVKLLDCFVNIFRYLRRRKMSSGQSRADEIMAKLGKAKVIF